MGKVRGKDWMQEHVADGYVKRAKAEGMRSRAAYKLVEIAERDRLLASGMVVVDLGAAPGGWSQIAAGRVGARGRVIALDVLEMTGLPGVTFIRGDFHDAAAVEQLERALGGEQVDLVLSDMAPNLSGIAMSDQARALELAELALEFALKHLKPKGNFLVKTFQGAGFDNFLKALRGRFQAVAVRKPEASRSRSSEVYLVGKGLRPR
jgi:23S rRNA (uridine2552-2'-O)-methyltransferase